MHPIVQIFCKVTAFVKNLAFCHVNKILFTEKRTDTIYLEPFQHYLKATLTQRNINTVLCIHNIDIVISFHCLNYCLCFEKLN